MVPKGHHSWIVLICRAQAINWAVTIVALLLLLLHHLPLQVVALSQGCDEGHLRHTGGKVNPEIRVKEHPFWLFPQNTFWEAALSPGPPGGWPGQSSPPQRGISLLHWVVWSHTRLLCHPHRVCVWLSGHHQHCRLGSPWSHLGEGSSCHTHCVATAPTEGR